MSPAVITVLVLLIALLVCFVWLHMRIADLEAETTDISQWIAETDRAKNATQDSTSNRREHD